MSSTCPQASVMAFSVTTKCWVLLVALVYVSFFGFKFGNAHEDLPETGSVDGHDIPQTGAVDGDPAQIVAKALLCFNDKFIYSSCEESYRLNERGNINVPPEYTDQYCNGPCLEETHLVLTCIGNILSNFFFYNKATIQDVRETLQAGCSYTSERGDFNVAKHIEADENSANKAGKSILFGFMPMIIGCGLLI